MPAPSFFVALVRIVAHQPKSVRIAVPTTCVSFVLTKKELDFCLFVHDLKLVINERALAVCEVFSEDVQRHDIPLP